MRSSMWIGLPRVFATEHSIPGVTKITVARASEPMPSDAGLPLRHGDGVNCGGTFSNLDPDYFIDVFGEYLSLGCLII